jgi:hypothetical protein
VHSIKKLAKETKNLMKAFTQLQNTSEQDFDPSGSKLEEDHLRFQFDDGFQFTQMEVKQMAIEFEQHIAKFIKQTHSTRITLDLKKVILLDSQSTMDLICDTALVESTFKSSHSMPLKSNGGTMEVNKQAIMSGYHMHNFKPKLSCKPKFFGLCRICTRPCRIQQTSGLLVFAHPAQRLHIHFYYTLLFLLLQVWLNHHSKWQVGKVPLRPSQTPPISGSKLNCT